MKKLLLLIILSLVITTCRQSVTPEKTEDPSFNVRVTRPEYVEYNNPVRTVGVLATRMEVKLSFKTGGIIRTVSVREGQEVEEGTELASLDLSEISAGVKQAEVAFEKTRRDYNRAKNLYRDSVVTLETLQDAKSAYDIALSKKKVADFNMKHSKIVAPARGIVQKILIEKNEMIAPGHPAILYATTENDWIVRVSLADKDIVRFSTQDSAVIEMDAFPGIRFPAEVSEIGSFADPVTGTFETELLLERTNPEFRTGLIARAWLFPEDSLAGWKIPFEAVLHLHEEMGIIYIADSGMAKKREIKSGQVIGDGLIVTRGLQGGEQVITEGAAYLDDGVPVRIMDSEKQN